MDRHQEVLRGLREPTSSLRHAIPDVWSAFLALHGAAMADGEVPTRIKEAVALAISVVKRCDGCIAYHAKAAARRVPHRGRRAARRRAADGRRHCVGVRTAVRGTRSSSSRRARPGAVAS